MAGYDTKEIQVMRNMALARAVGELRAALLACYDDNVFQDVLKPNITKAIELIEECQ